MLPVRVDPRGLAGPTQREAASAWWRSPIRGWHVPASVSDERTDQRIVEMAAGSPADAAVTGWAALAWMGARYFGGLERGERLPVPMALDNRRRMRPRPGIELCDEFLAPGDVVVVDGLRVTVATRSVCRMLRTTARLDDRVKVLDMAAFDDLCSPAEVEAYARAQLASRPHVTRIWGAIPHAEENCWSPMESLMRSVWAGAGHRRPLANVPLFDAAGRHLLTPDLFDPDAAVAGEYDGPDHRGADPRERDLGREELCRALGIELVTMIGASGASRTGFERRLAAAYDRAAQRRSPGGWTLDQPDWWVDTSTVRRRRELKAAERAVWLRRRAS